MTLNFNTNFQEYEMKMKTKKFKKKNALQHKNKKHTKNKQILF